MPVEDEGFDAQSGLHLLGSAYEEDEEEDEDCEDDDDDDNDEERKAAVQAAMMGITTHYSRFKSHQNPNFRMDSVMEDDEDDDGKSCDLRMNLEELVKVEDEEEHHSSEMDTARTTRFESNRARKHYDLKEEEENQDLTSHQRSNFSLARPNSSQEFFMKDKPGVAGLPIKGPNSTERPVYVNPKQYDRIMKRRIARARLEEMGRLSRERKPYLHESRHKHAVRRPRGPRGRFLTKEELAADKTDNSSLNPTLENVN